MRLLADIVERIVRDKNGKNMTYVVLWLAMLEKITKEELLMSLY
jgi:hypothetical protein